MAIDASLGQYPAHVVHAKVDWRVREQGHVGILARLVKLKDGILGRNGLGRSGLCRLGHLLLEEVGIVLAIAVLARHARL